MTLPVTVGGVVASWVGFLVVAFGVWCFTSWLITLWWGLGIVPFGVPPVTFWQAFGLQGLLWIGAAPFTMRGGK